MARYLCTAKEVIEIWENIQEFANVVIRTLLPQQEVECISIVVSTTKYARVEKC